MLNILNIFRVNDKSIMLYIVSTKCTNFRDFFFHRGIYLQLKVRQSHRCAGRGRLSNFSSKTKNYWGEVGGG